MKRFRRSIALGLGWAIACLALPVQALQTAEGNNASNVSGPAPVTDPANHRLKCSQSAPGATWNFPNASGTVNNCATVTVAPTDICSASPAANGCPAAGTDSKIGIGWLPTTVSTNTATGTMVLTGGTLTRVTGTGTATGTQTVTAVSSTDTWTYTPASSAVGRFSANGGVWTKVTGTGTSTGTATASSVASTDTATLTVTYTYTHTHTVTDVSGAVATSDSRLTDARTPTGDIHSVSPVQLTTGTSTVTGTTAALSATPTVRINTGTGTNQVIMGNDPRLTNARASTDVLNAGDGLRFLVTENMTDVRVESGTFTTTLTTAITATASTITTGTATKTYAVGGNSATYVITSTGTFTDSSTLCYTNTYVASASGTGTVSSTDTWMNSATATGSAAAVVTASFHTFYTATRTGTAYYTVTDTSTEVARTRTLTATSTGVLLSASGCSTDTATMTVTVTTTITGTTTHTNTSTATSANMSTNPTLVAYSDDGVIGGDRFLMNISECPSFGTSYYPYEPSGDCTDATVTLDGWNPARFSTAYPNDTWIMTTWDKQYSWVPRGKVRVWPWLKGETIVNGDVTHITVVFALYVCSGSGQLTQELGSAPITLSTTDWHQYYGEIPLPNGVIMDQTIGGSRNAICMVVTATSRFGSKNVWMGTTTAHPTRVNGPFYQQHDEL